MFNLYHIITRKGNVIEVAAESQREALRLTLYPDYTEIRVQPLTDEPITLSSEEWEFPHNAGEVTYAVAQIADENGVYYSIECTDVTISDYDLLPDGAVYDIRNALETPECAEYADLNIAKQAIMDAIDEADWVYEDCNKCYYPDPDRAYDEWRCNR